MLIICDSFCVMFWLINKYNFFDKNIKYVEFSINYLSNSTKVAEKDHSIFFIMLQKKCFYFYTQFRSFTDFYTKWCTTESPYKKHKGNIQKREKV